MSIHRGHVWVWQSGCVTLEVPATCTHAPGSQPGHQRPLGIPGLWGGYVISYRDGSGTALSKLAGLIRLTDITATAMPIPQAGKPKLKASEAPAEPGPALSQCPQPTSGPEPRPA